VTRSASSRRRDGAVRTGSGQTSARPAAPDAHLPDAKGDRLVRSTLQLLLSNGSGIVLGVTFWFVAARLYTPTNVGYGATEVNAMTLLTTFALLSLGTIFPRFLYPAGARAGVLLRAGYLASTSVALVASVVFLLVTMGHRSYIEPGLGPAIFFVAAVVLWVVFTIEDAALVGFRTTFWIPVENGSFSVAKILLLPIFVSIIPRAGVFTSWVLPVVGCTIAINLYLWRRVLPYHVARSKGAGVLPERKVFTKVIPGEYLGGLCFGAMASLPALMIASTLGVKQVAYFQTPWLAGTSFDGLLFSFAASLIVETTARPSSAPGTVRRSVRLALLILGPSVAIILIGAPWFLRIFLGTEYATHGTTLLRLLAIALPFMAVNVLYVTYARLARRVRRVLLVQVTIATLVLALTAGLISPLGITGAGVGYRRPEMSPGFAPGTSLVIRSSSDVASDPIEAPTTDAIQPVVGPASSSPEPEIPAVWRRQDVEPPGPDRAGPGDPDPRDPDPRDPPVAEA